MEPAHKTKDERPQKHSEAIISNLTSRSEAISPRDQKQSHLAAELVREGHCRR